MLLISNLWRPPTLQNPNFVILWSSLSLASLSISQNTLTYFFYFSFVWLFLFTYFILVNVGTSAIIILVALCIWKVVSNKSLLAKLVEGCTFLSVLIVSIVDFLLFFSEQTRLCIQVERLSLASSYYIH